MSETKQTQERAINFESQITELKNLINKLKIETNPNYAKNKSYWFLVLIEYNRQVEKEYSNLFDVSDQDELDQLLRTSGTDKVLTASALKQAIELINHSYIDELTEIGNLKYWNTLTKNYRNNIQTITEIKANDLIIIILSLDVDSFKHVNDLFGHDVGDGILKSLGESLSKNSRPEDLIARKGGEEFAVIKPMSLTSLKKAAWEQKISVDQFIKRLVEDFRQKVINDMNEKSPQYLRGVKTHITLSLGATNIEPDETPDEALMRADLMMYAAKHDDQLKNGSRTLITQKL